MEWYEAALVGIGAFAIVEIAHYFLTKKPSASPSCSTAEPQLVYQRPVRQSPRQSSMPCEAICPECNKIIRGKIIRSNIEGDYCWISLHKDDLSDENCRYTGSDITL